MTERQCWHLYTITVILAIALALTGCKVAQPTVTALSTPTTEHTATPDATATATHTPPATPTPTPWPTSTPPPTHTPVPTLALPVLAGTPVPIPQEPITPKNADHIEQLAIWGKGLVLQVTFSPDDEILAVATTIGIWLHDAQTLELIRFIYTDRRVDALSFSTDGATLFAAVDHNQIASYSVATGERTGKLDIGSFGSSVFWEDETPWAAVAISRRQRVEVWNLAEGTLHQVIEGLSDNVDELAISPDGTLLAIALWDRSIELWSVQAAVPLLTGLKGHQGDVYTLAFSPDGSILASGSSDHSTKLWSVETGEVLHDLRGHKDRVTSLSFSLDGTVLTAGAGIAHLLQLWDPSTGDLLRTLACDGCTDFAEKTALSADGATLATSGYRSRAVRLWDPQTGELLDSILGYGYLSISAVSPGLTAFVPVDETIQLWAIEAGQMVRTLSGHTDSISDLVLSGDGTTLASREAWGGNTVWIWDVATGQHWQTSGELLGGVSDITLSPDGERLAVSGEGTVFRIFDARTGQELYDRSVWHNSQLFFSQDGTRLASRGWSEATGNTEAQWWDVETGESLRFFEVPRDKDSGASWSSDLETMATWNQEGQIWIWDAATQEILHHLRGHPEKTSSVVFSPDDCLLVSGTEDGVTQVWDSGTGALLKTLITSSFRIHVAFSADGRLLILNSRDGTSRIWGISPEQ